MPRAEMSTARVLAVAAASLACLGAPTLSAADAARARLVAAPSPAEWASSSRLDLSLAFRTTARVRLSALAHAAWQGGPVTTATGETVTLYVSNRLAADEQARLSWANFFASLYHGPELSTAIIYQAPLSEVAAICGNAQAAGCYAPSSHTLVFPGDGDPSIDADIAAHEYGHHVAASRRNDPWDANDWGPKRWASEVGVCARAAAGAVFPGDEGEHYTLNAGEAWAETFRILNEQRGGPWAGLPLVVDASLAPDAGALAAALADVQQPWQGPTTTSWSGRFAGAARTGPARLTALVGPGARILLETAGGSRVRSLAAGRYAITVRDASSRDNFHLAGVGFDRRTGVSGRGVTVWRVDLKPGVYRYRSDTRPQSTRSFSISAGAPATPAPQARTLATPLDGLAQAIVSGSAGAQAEIVDAASGRVLAGPSAAPVAQICGQRSIVVRLLARRAGSFQVQVSTP